MTEIHNKETKFRFKEFEMDNSKSAMKISTDSIILGCWADISDVNSALDIGSGTGLLSLMLAQRGVKKVTGIEIDPTAHEESIGNALQSPWNSSVSFINGDITTAEIGKFDLIISNPPYFDIAFSGLTSPVPSRHLARHESSLNYKWLLKNGFSLLNSAKGRMCFISPSDREEEITFDSSLCRWKIVRKCRIASSPKKTPKRILWDLRPTSEIKPSEETLFIKHLNGDYTKEYIDLTKDFYVKF